MPGNESRPKSFGSNRRIASSDRKRHSGQASSMTPPLVAVTGKERVSATIGGASTRIAAGSPSPSSRQSAQQERASTATEASSTDTQRRRSRSRKSSKIQIKTKGRSSNASNSDVEKVRRKSQHSWNEAVDEVPVATEVDGDQTKSDYTLLPTKESRQNLPAMPVKKSNSYKRERMQGIVSQEGSRLSLMLPNTRSSSARKERAPLYDPVWVEHRASSLSINNPYKRISSVSDENLGRKAAEKHKHRGSILRDRKEILQNPSMFPPFRGEYPTRNPRDTYKYYQRRGPKGILHAVCDECEDSTGEGKIMTCEVTEEHFVSLGPNEENRKDTNYNEHDVRTDLQQHQPLNGWPTSRASRGCLGVAPSAAGYMYQQPTQRPCPCVQQQQPLDPPASTSAAVGGQNMSSSCWGRQLQRPMCPAQQQQPQQQQPKCQQCQPCQQQQQQQQPQQQQHPCCLCAQQAQLNLHSQAAQYATNTTYQAFPDQGQYANQAQVLPEAGSCLTDKLAQQLQQQMSQAQAQIAQVQKQLNYVVYAQSKVRQPQMAYPYGPMDEHLYESSSTQDISGRRQPKFALVPSNVNIAPSTHFINPESLQAMSPQSAPLPPPPVPTPALGLQFTAYSMPTLQNCLNVDPAMQCTCSSGNQPAPLSSSPATSQPQSSQEQQQQPNLYPCPNSHCCTGCCRQRYAQMRFMMPRRWPGH